MWVITKLIELAQEEFADCAEDAADFNLKVYLQEVALLTDYLNGLAPHSELFAVNLNCEFEEAKCILTLTPNGLVVDQWEENEDFVWPILDSTDPEDPDEPVEQMERLSNIGEEIPINDLILYRTFLIYPRQSERDMEVIIEKMIYTRRHHKVPLSKV
ncbi:MAG: hypothetical protein JXM69_05715 [Anaerolineae bacterium]|nr:hypothetical protein [Anaerolineae bacterium]